MIGANTGAGIFKINSRDIIRSPPYGYDGFLRFLTVFRAATAKTGTIRGTNRGHAPGVGSNILIYNVQEQWCLMGI